MSSIEERIIIIHMAFVFKYLPKKPAALLNNLNICIPVRYPWNKAIALSSPLRIIAFGLNSPISRLQIGKWV